MAKKSSPSISLFVCLSRARTALLSLALLFSFFRLEHSRAPQFLTFHFHIHSAKHLHGKHIQPLIFLYKVSHIQMKPTVQFSNRATLKRAKIKVEQIGAEISPHFKDQVLNFSGWFPLS